MGDHAVNRFVEEVTIEPDAIARAREAALELGAEPISAAVGVQCATIAAVGRALNIVEIGTGGGVSGLRLSPRSMSSPSISGQRVRLSRRRRCRPLAPGSSRAAQPRCFRA